MNSHELIESFGEFARSKNIDRPTMMSILDDVFRTMIRKKYDQDENFDVIINPDNGDLEIWRNREIVDDDSEDVWDLDKIPLAEAQKVEPDFEVGESVAEPIKIEEFGRRAVLMARQTLIQRVKDMERDNLSALDGETTLRYGHADVSGEACGVARQVAGVLTVRGWTGVLRPCPRCLR